MDVEQLIKLIDKVSGSELTGFKYEENGVKLQLSKKENQVVKVTSLSSASMEEAAGGAGIVAETNVTGAQKEEKISEASPLGNVVKAPLVGTFYAAPAEDAPPFIQVGDSVKKGDVLVYGWIPILNDTGDQILQYINKNADGDVQILGSYEFSYEEKLAYEKRIATGEQREYIIIGTNHSNLNLIPYMLGRTTHTTMTKVKQLRFGGVLPLPIYCNHLTEKSYILQQSTHSKKEMQDIMQKHLFDLNKNFQEKGIQIVDKGNSK